MTCWLTKRGFGQCIEESAVLLDVTPIEQSGENDCGIACYQMLCDFFAQPPKQKLPEVDENGLLAIQLVKLLESTGFSVNHGRGRGDLLKFYITRRIPVVVLLGIMGGHWSVVRGYERGAVYLADPSKGQIKLSIADFESTWQDEGNYYVAGWV